MTDGDGLRRTAMRATTPRRRTSRKRQSLNSFVVGVKGTTAHEVVASLTPGSSIVDIGCGHGLWMEQGARRGDVVGVDPSVRMLINARSRCGSPVVCADASRQPLRDQSADAVLMLWMLYHDEDKGSALREARRVLRPEGRLVAATNAPSEDGPHADIIGRALSHCLGRRVDRWIEPLDFNADNGESILSNHFASVATHRWSVEFELHDPEPLVAYLDSGRDPIEAEVGPDVPWTTVPATAEELISNHIGEHGSLRFERRGATFVAT